VLLDPLQRDSHVLTPHTATRARRARFSAASGTARSQGLTDEAAARGRLISLSAVRRAGKPIGCDLHGRACTFSRERESVRQRVALPPKSDTGYARENKIDDVSAVLRGAEGFADTIDQLFGYTGWRDTKLAIVMFVREKGLTGILKKAKTTLAAHPQFVA